MINFFLPYRANELPLIFSQARCAEIKVARKLMEIKGIDDWKHIYKKIKLFKATVAVIELVYLHNNGC